MGRKIELDKSDKKSPNVYLTEKVGSKIVGILKRRFSSKVYPGKMSYLIETEFTDASTRVWNADTRTETEVEIAPKDSVFLKGTTLLDQYLAKVADGQKVEIVYIGKGEASPGRKPPFLFDVFEGGR